MSDSLHNVQFVLCSLVALIIVANMGFNIRKVILLILYVMMFICWMILILSKEGNEQ